MSELSLYALLYSRTPTPPPEGTIPVPAPGLVIWRNASAAFIAPSVVVVAVLVKPRVDILGDRVPVPNIAGRPHILLVHQGILVYILVQRLLIC